MSTKVFPHVTGGQPPVQPPASSWFRRFWAAAVMAVLAHAYGALLVIKVFAK